jgi:hypothetical protein
MTNETQTSGVPNADCESALAGQLHAAQSAHTGLGDAGAAVHNLARLPGETPRAFGAFTTYVRLGQARSHQAVAEKLGEGLPSIKNWASRFDWTSRVAEYNDGLLTRQLEAEAAVHKQQAADWAVRLEKFREQEWDAAQKLIAAAQCFLETFGDEALEKMTLAQVSRALDISSRIGRLALVGAELPPPVEPVESSFQKQFNDALNRVYRPGQAQPSSGQDPLPPSPISFNPSTSQS